MELNQKQQTAVKATEPNIVVVSPAGSGKTTTLTASILKHRELYPTDRIAAITFTKKAAAELEERLGSMLNLSVGTIHSWSYNRLKILASEYNFKIHLLEDEVIKEILKKICTRKRQFYINQFQLFSFVMGNYNIDIDDNVKRTFEMLRLEYIKFKNEQVLYDFTDLPKYLLDKMNEYEVDITDIDALYVDEFQDVDPVQLEVFNRVLTKKKYYIGDPAQSIYIFRGASEEVFKQLKDFSFYDLDMNYRSYQEIIDYASTVRNIGLSNLKERRFFDFLEIDFIEPSNIICQRNNGGNVFRIDNIGSCINLKDGKHSSDILVIKKLLADKNTQVLCRGNKQVKKLQALEINNVSTIHQAKGLEYDNVILTSFPIDNMEELNVAYVGMTRARNNLCVIDYEILCYIICQEDIKTTNKLF